MGGLGGLMNVGTNGQMDRPIGLWMDQEIDRQTDVIMWRRNCQKERNK